jgi:hypothetical protein
MPALPRLTYPFRTLEPLDGIDPNPPEYLQVQEFQAAILAAREDPGCVSSVPTAEHSRRPKAGCSCRTSAVSASSPSAI